MPFELNSGLATRGVLGMNKPYHAMIDGLGGSDDDRSAMDIWSAGIVSIWMASSGKAPGSREEWGSQQPFQQIFGMAAKCALSDGEVPGTDTFFQAVQNFKYVDQTFGSADALKNTLKRIECGKYDEAKLEQLVKDIRENCKVCCANLPDLDVPLQCNPSGYRIFGETDQEQSAGFDLLSKMLRVNPKERVKPAEALHHHLPQ